MPRWSPGRRGSPTRAAFVGSSIISSTWPRPSWRVPGCGPERVNGIDQQPMHGISMGYTFDDAAATDRRTTQYFELLGGRAIYHDGWWAGTRHGADGLSAAQGGVPYDQDTWELYDTSKVGEENLYRVEAQPLKLVEESTSLQGVVVLGEGEVARALGVEALPQLEALLQKAEVPRVLVVDATLGLEGEVAETAQEETAKALGLLQGCWRTRAWRTRSWCG